MEALQTQVKMEKAVSAWRCAVLLHSSLQCSSSTSTARRCDRVLHNARLARDFVFSESTFSITNPANQMRFHSVLSPEWVREKHNPEMSASSTHERLLHALVDGITGSTITGATSKPSVCCDRSLAAVRSETILHKAGVEQTVWCAWLSPQEQSNSLPLLHLSAQRLLNYNSMETFSVHHLALCIFQRVDKYLHTLERTDSYWFVTWEGKQSFFKTDFIYKPLD